jgi:hypothetical protein
MRPAKNMPAAPPAIFSKASASVPWRSGVNVCKNSRSAGSADAAHEDGASRMGEAKKHANGRKGDQVFKMLISRRIKIGDSLKYMECLATAFSKPLTRSLHRF